MNGAPVDHDVAPPDERVEAWISARHVHAMRARAEALGFRFEPALRAASLTAEQLEDPAGRVPLRAIEQLLERAGARADRAPLGLELARDVQPATFGALGFIVQACARFSEVLESLVRFNGLSSNLGRVSVLHELEGVHVQWTCRSGSPAFRRHATDYVLGSLAVLVRLLAPTPRNLLREVRLPHDCDGGESLAAYQAFFSAPIVVGADVGAIVLDASVLAMRLQNGDSLVKQLLEGHARERIREADAAPDFLTDLRQHIGTVMLERAPTRDVVASRMGMSARSLVRRLAELGTSFRGELDAVRLASAERALRDSRDSHEALGALAERHGFASAQAFMRWFKARTGTTVGEFRKRTGERGTP